MYFEIILYIFLGILIFFGLYWCGFLYRLKKGLVYKGNLSILDIVVLVLTCMFIVFCVVIILEFIFFMALLAISVIISGLL